MQGQPQSAKGSRVPCSSSLMVLSSAFGPLGFLAPLGTPLPWLCRVSATGLSDEGKRGRQDVKLQTLLRAVGQGGGHHTPSTVLSAPCCCILERAVLRVADPLRPSQASRPPESPKGQGPCSVSLQVVTHSCFL